MNLQDQQSNFGQAMLPQLDAAYNLARWLVRDASLAEDAVHEAYTRAEHSFAARSRSDRAPGRAWLLGLVRASCHARLDRDGAPVDGVLKRRHGNGIDGALAALPLAWRECIVLHDIEGLSYADLAQIIDVPLGTVMNRLVEARRALRHGCMIGTPAIQLEPITVEH